MNIVFLMAGRGSRFREVGYKEPKSLIEIRGRSMVEWAVRPLSFIRKRKLFFLCLREYEKFGLSRKLNTLYGPNITVLFADTVTEGAAMTALLAREFIDTDEELIISNADQYFESSEFRKELSKKHKEFSGIIPIFEATHPRWSFAKINGNKYVTEVAEKVPISNNATVGVYYFKRGKDFVWAAEEMIKKDIRRNNEFYVCPVFNELIGRGDRIKSVRAEAMWGLGTPEDVEYFKRYYKGVE